ncbi:MAG: alpha/beta hydrolase [Casimicrobium sp.]
MNANVDILKLPTMLRAFLFSIEALWAQVSLLNLRTLEPVLKMPVFLFLGRNDRWVPLEFSGIYFDRLTAPSKKLVWFEQSGHKNFVDEPTKFNRAMLELVRPAAVEKLSASLAAEVCSE